MPLQPNEVKTEHISTGAVTTPKIADEAVTTAKIKDSAIKTEKIATGAVTGSKIGAGQIYGSKLRDGAVRSEKIAAGAITTTKIGELQVTTSRLQDKSVTTDKLASGAVTTEKIANASVTPAKLSFTPPSIARPITPPVASSELEVRSVTTEKLADGAVTTPKLAAGIGLYVPRAVTDPDKTILDFICDGGLHEDGLDFSAIVPAGARAVVFNAETMLSIFIPPAKIYRNQVYRQNTFILPVETGGSWAGGHYILPCDPDRLFDYEVGNGYGAINLTVIGWFI